jgi:translation initiation factor 4G
LKDLLNKLTPDNYNVIKELILEIIKEDVQVQDKFIDVLFQKAVLEEAYVWLCSKLVKDLDKDLPQKTQRKEKNKKEYSEMRTHLIDKCRTFFKIENNEQFDEYIKEKDPKDRRNQLKKNLFRKCQLYNRINKNKNII